MRFAKNDNWHGGEGGSAMIRMRVTVDDVKTVYGHTSSNSNPGALYYQPGYGGSVKNPEFCIKDASNVEVLDIERVK